jgi:hypothetical protein
MKLGTANLCDKYHVLIKYADGSLENNFTGLTISCSTGTKKNLSDLKRIICTCTHCVLDAGNT